MVAHHVSVMTVQRRRRSDDAGEGPQVARDALVSIEEMGRTAMAEMRSIVGVLRTDGPRRAGAAAGDARPARPRRPDAGGGLTTQLWVEGEVRQLPPASTWPPTGWCRRR